MAHWLSHAEKQVPAHVRRRGFDHAARGRVRVLAGTPDLVEARVGDGRGQQGVVLERDGDAIIVECACRDFVKQGEPCEHVWGALVQAAALNHLSEGGVNSEVCLLTAEEAFLEEADTFLAPPPPPGRPAPPIRVVSPPRPSAPAPPRWKRSLDRIAAAMDEVEPSHDRRWPAHREIRYIVDIAGTLAGERVTLDIMFRDRRKNGEWGKPKLPRADWGEIQTMAPPADREMLSVLRGADARSDHPVPSRYVLNEAIARTLLPKLCGTGRCFLRPDHPDAPETVEYGPIKWDRGGAWILHLAVTPNEGAPEYLVRGVLRRDGDEMAVTAPLLLLAGGLLFQQDRIALLDHGGAFQWIALLRQENTIRVPQDEAEEFVRRLVRLPTWPRLDLPEALAFEEVAIAPRPRLKVESPGGTGRAPTLLLGAVSFDYDGVNVPADDIGEGAYQPERHRFMRRDRDGEREALEGLRRLGFVQRFSWEGRRRLELAPKKLPRVVRELVSAGWLVEAEGKLFRTARAFRLEVTTGIDWFELHGGVDFGEATATLPALLAALERGETSVRLDDGTLGMVPEEWLRKIGWVVGLGSAVDDHLRFGRSQVGLLDALLAAQPEASCDEAFARARGEMARFEGIRPLDPSGDFRGELRPYQRDGLGWLRFLAQFGFGGCLADDMGLGKTVQVLALLASRPAGTGRPSLVVVPRSLVFNWMQEAARFAPGLRILDHTGIDRVRATECMEAHDLVIATYGTLRRDAAFLKDQDFEYVILDEAQAIKNPDTESAKAARLLRASHRLALSGTPVENHLGELWSLLEFLNPGMLGKAAVFRGLGDSSRLQDPEVTRLLSRALRPFILRRTKEQVARDLPSKLEQTIYCDLEPPQRKLYDELRDHYRAALLGRIERDGMKKSQIQILEALLRLRQAAIHPGLIDKTRVEEPSAKLDLLVSRLGEVIEEGHKALVFSQFTSMLAIVRSRLEVAGVVYEYLDGRTRDRAARVRRFQEDEGCRLFLVSLKAGGLGLNLTAADYVFLLDPWWNPAVESQAVDRTHRIGQSRQVFAYRLIARDTVEEKVLALQRSKRALVDAVITADNSMLRNLSRGDLEILLS